MKPRFLYFVLSLLLAFAPLAHAQNKDLLKVPISQARSVDKIAVVIGVDDYFNADKLSACGKDARAFAQFLQTQWGFAPANIILMSDSATDRRRRTDRNSINRVLRNFTAGVNENSEVVFFFSDHGLRDKNEDYLAPLDADPEDIDGACLNYTQLRNQLEGRNPRRCLLLTDDCRNTRGADINAQSVQGGTPLHLAIPFHAEKAVALLLAKGADVNARDYMGWTPLHHAVRNNSDTVMSLLLAHGADANTRDEDNKTPLGLAKATKVIPLLTAAGGHE